MSDEMKGKVALITGGSSGIGKAAAFAFANEGAQVVIASRSEDTGEKAASDIRQSGGNAKWIRADVTQEDQVKTLVTLILEEYGRLDYAFNNAGSGGKGGWTTEIEEEDWDKTISGFLKSVWLCMKHELPAMLDNGQGSIVNNSSVDGKRGFRWDPVYSAAKHGVIGLTKSSALQYAQQGIRINAICPGWIITPPVEKILEHNPEAGNGMLLHQPIGRFGKPEEVAQAVVWLCSDKSSLITGTVLPIDGGYLAI
ncbi:MAG: hypothetical protein AVO35_04685 [Candidatus Aegiribacteria sp. MLS_C]|nr:MAG: hypothetical protein AVO35_04685 [Candidatus Aegiribacteria sp. MLS_C]